MFDLFISIHLCSSLFTSIVNPTVFLFGSHPYQTLPDFTTKSYQLPGTDSLGNFSGNPWLYHPTIGFL